MATAQNPYQGRLALVTGGSSGIGLALAHLLAREGANVWILARREQTLRSALQTLFSFNGQKHGVICADVSDWGEVQISLERLQREVGTPDLLINSAGVTYPGYVNDIPLDIYREMMEINYFGTLHMVKALLPAMLERRSGHIVNISSAAAYVTGPGYAAYSPSKYAVRGFSDVLRAEVKPHGLQVSLVFPPDTDTPQLAFEKEHKTPELQQLSDDAGLGPIHFGALSADQVAGDIIDGVRRRKYIILPGRGNVVMYHLTRLLGNVVYPLTDDQWAVARRKNGKNTGDD
jgi:3-dehydrosphinganine reductase